MADPNLVRAHDATILIVDDSLPIHNLIKGVLADDPYQFESALFGQDGITMARAGHPDLILLDLDLPDVHGFDVCRTLKLDPETASIAIIFLTAAIASESKVAGLRLEVADYITKPFDAEELRERVRSALRIKRLLDLLPAGAKPDPGATANSGPNRRLTLNELTDARSQNPWVRIPPVATL